MLKAKTESKIVK